VIYRNPKLNSTSVVSDGTIKYKPVSSIVFLPALSSRVPDPVSLSPKSHHHNQFTSS